MRSDFTPPLIAVLTSHAAPGIDRLLNDPKRGMLYELVGVISSETHLHEHARIENAAVPLIHHPIKTFHEEKRLPFRNLQARAEYDVATVEMLQRLGADYVLLDGYHYILTDALLSAFPQRIIALHDGDLSRLDENGQRLFAGLHSVRDALFAGQTETRTSAAVITREVGGGPLLLLSGPFPVPQLARDAREWGLIDLLTMYADLHRRWMVEASYGEMLVRIAEIVAAGTMHIVGDIVWVDGVPGPCRMGEAPSACYGRQAEEPGIPASCPFITR